ncbi:MAG: DUF3798 domain-containing protein [Spirochaetes bacterium]|nr:DUF3798 domain-containing protein [Spirochaetota bacterium]
MKKQVCGILMLLLVLPLFLFASGGKEGAATLKDYKIGIMTGTVVQNEEEFRKAESIQKTFGADRIVIATYPARFMQEQETTISNMMAMASDPKVKGIVFVQAVPGAAAAIDRVRQVRPDMFFVLGVPGEDPDMIAGKGDIVLQTNDLARGEQIAQQAKKLGAKTLVHYSFPRHMSYEMLSARRTLMKEAAAKLGLRFVEQDAPDPTGDAGVPGTQQFIMEDVPRKVAQFGPDTAFFGTNCAMQEPMIRQVVANKAIYPVQCCPSPFHALPNALGIAVPPEKKADVAWILSEEKAKITSSGMSGRVSTWPTPVNMMYMEAGVRYAMEYIEGKTKGKVDKAKLISIMESIAGGKVELTEYTSRKSGKTYPNYFLYLSEFYNF